ncbi:MAG TPA: phosphate ABC transporter substrate-binding protein [Candidatus Saccharicenans sp.]|nr:phosphate ABC transporter substrate-binding protein [Candidatus Saccharicenans sp.]HQH60929.1 phosphate ABC transporter substrate-binding protein [Candidatus Saccharicenans sp.]
MNSESKESGEKYRQTGFQSFFQGRPDFHLNCRTVTGILYLAFFLILATFCLMSFSACKSGSKQNEIVIAGSTSIQPFADEWAELFMKKNSKVTINVQGGGSSGGIMAVKEGTAQIGMSSRELKEDEKDLIEITVAYDGLAIIVHPANPVDNLSLEQVRSIFAGEITNWKVLNGNDKAITVVVREEGSGTRGAFQEMVMGSRRISKKAIVEDSNGVVREIVSRDSNSIGFISLGLVDHRVKAIALDGLQPSEEAIIQGHYHLRRPFLFLVREEPQGLIKEFIDFVLSADIQSMLPQEGLIPVKTIATEESFQD